MQRTAGFLYCIWYGEAADAVKCKYSLDVF